MTKNISYLFFGVIMSSVLGEGIYVEMTGREYFLPEIFYPLALIGFLFVVVTLLPPEIRKYRLYLSQNPQVRAKDLRSRRLMYVGIGLIPFSLILIVLSRHLLASSAPNWLILFGFITSVSLLLIGGTLIIYRILLWSVYYHKHVDRE